MAILGVGMGMTIAPNNNATMSAAPESRRGIGSGLLNMFRFTGLALGVAFTRTAFAGFASANGLALYHVPSPADAAAYSTTPAGLANFQAAFSPALKRPRWWPCRSY